MFCAVNLRNSEGLGGFWGLCVGMAWNSWAPLCLTVHPPLVLCLPDTPQASRLLRLKGLLMLKGPDQTALVSCGAAAAVSQGTPLQWLSCESHPTQHSRALEMENGRSLCPRSGKCSWLKFFSSFFFFCVWQTNAFLQRRWTRIRRNQMCVFGMQYFCITNSYILTHINPMICEFCQLLLCLLNQIQ